MTKVGNLHLPRGRLPNSTPVSLHLQRARESKTAETTTTFGTDQKAPTKKGDRDQRGRY